MFEAQITPCRRSALATITVLVACVFAAGRLDAAVIVLWVPISPPTVISSTATIKAATPQRPLAPASTIPSVKLADRRYEIDGTPLSSVLIDRRPADQQLRPPLPPHDLLDDARLADTDPDTYQLGTDEQYRFFLEMLGETNARSQSADRGDRLDEPTTELPGTVHAYRVISDFARSAVATGSCHVFAIASTVNQSIAAELDQFVAVADQWSRAAATVNAEHGNPYARTIANSSHTSFDKSPVEDLSVLDTVITNNLDAVDAILRANNQRSDVTAAPRDASATLAAPILLGTADALESVSAWLSDVSDSITARAKP